MRKERGPVTVKTVGRYRVGDVCEMTVARLGEVGAFLDAGTGNTSDDILLHQHQQTSPVKVGDKVKVYLYLDAKGRMTASMKLPKMREGQLGYVKVLSVTRQGGFVDIGAERGGVPALQRNAGPCVSGTAGMGEALPGQKRPAGGDHAGGRGYGPGFRTG